MQMPFTFERILRLGVEALAFELVITGIVVESVTEAVFYQLL